MYTGSYEVQEVPECEGGRHEAILRINGLFVCADHADLASEESGNEIQELVLVKEATAPSHLLSTHARTWGPRRTESSRGSRGGESWVVRSRR